MTTLYNSSIFQNTTLELYRKKSDTNTFSFEIFVRNVISQKIMEIKSQGKGHDSLNASSIKLITYLAPHITYIVNICLEKIYNFQNSEEKQQLSIFQKSMM